MVQPTPGDVHVSTALTMVSLAMLQNPNAFIADKVFPTVPVDKKNDSYYIFPRGSFNRNQMKKRAPSTESPGIGYEVSTDPYSASVWALHHDIDDQTRGNADSPVDLDRNATELLTMQAMISREVAWASNFFTTGIWTTDITGISSGTPSGSQALQWNDANSDPIEKIRAAITAVLESTGVHMNTMVITPRVMNALVDHPDIVDRVKYGQTNGGPAIVGVPELQALFKIPRILVMEAIVNSAAEGQSDSHAFIGGKHALLCYSAPNPGLMIPTAGYTFAWRGFLGATNMGHRMKKFRIEHLNSDRVEIEMAYAHEKVAADLGYFFSGIVA